ncbi:MAG: TIGR03013 family PEP-CTERM/XrtA system glycosyltransferase [Alphaproteobacteria bacterium]|nr:MAG: TIGR03013 family PEP-CTERM/XrtA system glycosyltransferase [Alphaproteobacteria bacterium]
MIRIFKHYVPKSVFVLGFVEVAILWAAIAAGLTIRYAQLGDTDVSLARYQVEFATFVCVVYVSMLAVGMYQLETCRDFRLSLVRLGAALLLSLVIGSVVLYLFPDVDIWRSVFLFALGLAAVGIVISRFVFVHVADMNLFRRRVLVLGARRAAKRIQDLEQGPGRDAFTCVGFLRMTDHPPDVEGAIPFAEALPLADYARRLEASEIVVAIEERRGTLPTEELLACKMQGLKVTDGTTFIERETGTVDLDSLNPSWLIFSDGFGGVGRADLVIKRLFDISASLILLFLSLPILVTTAIAVKLTSPGPIFYRQERVGQFGKTYNVMKFRSMRNDAEKEGPVWARQNDTRVTPVGRFIRSTRIDEIPQIFNVLKGDMSFVGPRPERPVFVEELAKQIPYYSERHQVKPGITGWAQINYPYGASIEDAKQKLQYDLYYIKNYSIFLDFLILVQTLRVVLWPEGVR